MGGWVGRWVGGWVGGFTFLKVISFRWLSKKRRRMRVGKSLRRVS